MNDRMEQSRTTEFVALANLIHDHRCSMHGEWIEAEHRTRYTRLPVDEFCFDLAEVIEREYVAARVFEAKTEVLGNVLHAIESKRTDDEGLLTDFVYNCAVDHCFAAAKHSGDEAMADARRPPSDANEDWNKIACIVCEVRVPAYRMTDHHKAHAEEAVKTSVCRCGHGQDVHVTRCQGAIGGSKPCWCRSFENRDEQE